MFEMVWKKAISDIDATLRALLLRMGAEEIRSDISSVLWTLHAENSTVHSDLLSGSAGSFLRTIVDQEILAAIFP